MPASDRPIRIGGVDIDREQALAAAAQYLATQGQRFGYPAYDRFDSGAGAFRIGDGDLLTPVLLNVPLSIKNFYALATLRPRLEDWLLSVPIDARLLDAGPTELNLLGELFAVLDAEPRQPHIRGSILAKVMHRKRPAFVPLYDRHVDHCYRMTDSAPITPNPRRKWQEFIPMLGQAMIEDLRREAGVLSEVMAMASVPTITSLRALDIVAWQAGRRTGSRPGLWSNDAPEEFEGTLEDDDVLTDLVDDDER